MSRARHTTGYIHVTCPQHATTALRAEVEQLGYTIIDEGEAGLGLRGSFRDCMRLNLWLRTAHRVLWRLQRVRARDAHDLYDKTYAIAWEDWIPTDGYVSVVSSVRTDAVDNGLYANRRCKDAIVDRIRDRRGSRPDSGPNTDRAVVFLYWHGEDMTISIDTSGTPLSERGYRLQPGKAPLRESLAAAMILSSQWNPGEAFVNPMGGSGTLAIEAALMARGQAPGLLRSSFGFQHVLRYDAEHWQTLRADARAAVRVPSEAVIVCTDHNPDAVDAARQNAARAGVAADIVFDVCDFRQTVVPEPPGVVMLNPEYGLRLGDAEALREIYRSIGDFLKQSCSGYTGYVLTGNMALTKEVGLRARRRIPFWNADIECRLLEYELYVGTRKQPATV